MANYRVVEHKWAYGDTVLTTYKIQKAVRVFGHDIWYSVYDMHDKNRVDEVFNSFCKHGMYPVLKPDRVIRSSCDEQAPAKPNDDGPDT